MRQDDGPALFETRVVAADTHHSYCYPCSLALLPGGRLMTTYAATWHDEATGWFRCKAMASFSQDEGRSWDAPVPLFYDGVPFEDEAPPPQDFCDANIAVFGGRVVVYCQSVRHTEGGDLSKSYEWVRESLDGGRTWSALRQVPHDECYFAGTNHKALRLAGGATVRGFSWEVKAQEGIHTGGEGDQHYRSCLLRSEDEGQSWQKGADVDVEARAQDALPYAIHGAGEPAYVQLADGSLYLLARTGDNCLYEARSRDEGRSWDGPRPSILTSHNCPAELLRINDSEVIVLYNDHPRLRTRLCVRLSSDGCESWGPPKVVAPAGWCGEEEVAYPVAQLLPDGTIAAVWGEYRKKSATDRYKICSARFTRSWILA